MISHEDITSEKSNLQAFYWCFISYRHSDNSVQDRYWATWLHREIEQYDVPAEIVGTANNRGELIPERIYPVFRDEDSLPADAHLGERIREALDASRYLVVLCSPRAVESRYVEEEILHFVDSGKKERVVTAILAGSPGNSESECFPAPLRKENDSDIYAGPLAADFRLQDGSEGWTSAEAYRRELRNSKLPKHELNKRAGAYEARLQLMKLKVIAGILGVSLEELRDRDKAYQLERARKRARIRGWISFAFAVIASVATVAGIVAFLQRQEADRQRLEVVAQQQKTQKALEAANAAASGLVTELVANTRTWPGIDSMFKTRILVRAQNVLLAAIVAGDEDERNQAELRRSLAIVYSELASVKMEIGDHTLAENMIDAAEDQFLRLYDEDPSSESLKDLLIVRRKRADLSMLSSDYQSSIQAAEGALALLEAAGQFKDDDIQFEFSAIHTRLGNAYWQLDNNSKAEHHFREANGFLERIIREESSIQYQRSLAATYVNLANLIDPSSRSEEVLSYLDKAGKVIRKISEKSRDGSLDTELMKLQMKVFEGEAGVYEASGEFEKEVDSRERAISAALDQLKANPQNTIVADTFADKLEELAAREIQMNHLEPAVQHLQISIKIRRQLFDALREKGDLTKLRLRLAKSLIMLFHASAIEEPLIEAKTIIGDLISDAQWEGATVQGVVKELEKQFAKEAKH